jgi:glycine/D-amino acid oxidase-like deaminating enzyme
VNAARNIDFLIVGQGLAGSALAMKCCERRYKILVFDDPSQNHSSRVAAGLFNPVTGKYMTKTWLADLIFPTLFEYYTAVEGLTRRRFFNPIPIYRPFAGIEEQNEWMGRSAAASYDAFVSNISQAPAFKGKINEPFGGVTLKQSGYLDTRAYLEAVRTYLEDRGAYRAQKFDGEKLEVRDDWVQYGDISAKKIIFCQGVQNATNRWFNTCPVEPLKGEMIQVQCALPMDVIFNRGVFMVPGPNSSDWRVGATYNREDHEPQVTASARDELTRKLDDLVRVPFSVTGQYWGVRPTTPDRRPVIGSHPNLRSMVIFNGLGTKGVSLAPYFSEILIRWLEGRGAIGKEADISRFN